MITVLTLALSMTAGITAPPQSAAGRESVEKTIAEAIRVLEAKDYRQFLSEFVLPKNLEAVAGTPEAFEQLVKELPVRSGKFLFALKDAQGRAPIYDAAKTTATFPPAGGEPGLKLTKLDRRWYIANK